MSAPTSIGGKVLDASAVAAVVHGRISAVTWVDISRSAGIPLYLPTLAVSEVRALRPGSGRVLADLLGHPWVVLGDLDTETLAAIDVLFDLASAADTSSAGVDVVDVLAAHVVHVAGARRWPVLTTDPARLRRLAPDVEVELL